MTHITAPSDEDTAPPGEETDLETATADLCEFCYMTDAPQCGPPWCVNRNQGEGA